MQSLMHSYIMQKSNRIVTQIKSDRFVPSDMSYYHNNKWQCIIFKILFQHMSIPQKKIQSRIAWLLNWFFHYEFTWITANSIKNWVLFCFLAPSVLLPLKYRKCCRILHFIALGLESFAGRQIFSLSMRWLYSTKK